MIYAIVVIALLALFIWIVIWAEGRTPKDEGRPKDEERPQRESKVVSGNYTLDDLFYRQGNDFEGYAIGLFDPGRYELIHRTPRHDETGGRFVKGMELPDLRFRDLMTGECFWVECKWRSHTGPRGEVTWCTEIQRRRYLDAGRMTGERVYVILGIGGTPTHPGEVYLMDIGTIPWCTLFRGTYVRYRFGGMRG